MCGTQIQKAKAIELYLVNPRKGTPYSGTRVQTCHLVPCLGDALGTVGIKKTHFPPKILTCDPEISLRFGTQVQGHRQVIRKLEEVDGGQSPAAQEVPRDDAVRHRALVLSLVQLIDLELEKYHIFS